MTFDLSHIRLINFDDVGAANRLFAQIGVESDLGSFLAELVQDVFQKQYPDLKLESIKLLSIGDCTFAGKRSKDETIADVELLEIPVAIEAFLMVQKETYLLNLVVTIRATLASSGYEVESDVVIKDQRGVR